MKPPTRKRNTRGKDLNFEQYSKWSLQERKLLLKALHKYSVNQTAEIAEIVSTKSENEVIHYLTKLKRSLKINVFAVRNSLERNSLRNLEDWIRFTLQLVDDKEETYSSIIGKLVAIYGEYCFKKSDSSTGVDFKAIYDYLSGLLLGIQCPILPPLESAIVLDLMKNLSSILSHSDFEDHSRYILLNHQKHTSSNFDSLAELELSKLSKPIQKPRSQAPTSTHSSSTKLTDKKEPPIFNKTYQEKILPDGTKATIVHLEVVKPLEKESNSQNQESELTEKSFEVLGSISGNKQAASISSKNTNSKEVTNLCDSDEAINQEILQCDQDCTKNNPTQTKDQDQLESANNKTNQTPVKRLLVSNTSPLHPISSGRPVLQVPAGATVLHLPNGGVIKKEYDGSSILHMPNGGIIKREGDSRLFHLPSGSMIQGSASVSAKPNNPEASKNQSKNPVRKQTILSKLICDPIENIVGQMPESVNAPQGSDKELTNNKSNIAHTSTDRLASNISRFSNPTTQGLVKDSSAHSNQLLESNRLDKLKSQSQLMPQSPKGSSKILKDPRAVSGSKKPWDALILKRTSVGSEYLSQQERHSKKLKTHDSANFDYKSEKCLYKPSVSWLNPMAIPAHLINFE